jgi:pyrroloquinoline quinone (PQQ) biosynthesis protein C
MPFFETLERTTSHARSTLLGAPIIADALAGRVTSAQYIAFLSRAYHHVKHTPSLLMACGARIGESLEWLRAAIADYAREEIGHHQWILDDIEAAGGDAAAVRDGAAEFNTEMLVAYAYDIVARRNPVGLFGMVYVLEGTSIRLASNVAAAVQKSLGLPSRAFTYLTSHGALDVDHMRHFESLMNRLDDEDDRASVAHCAKACFRLYANVLGSIERSPA